MVGIQLVDCPPEDESCRNRKVEHPLPVNDPYRVPTQDQVVKDQINVCRTEKPVFSRPACFPEHLPKCILPFFSDSTVFYFSLKQKTPECVCHLEDKCTITFFGSLSHPLPEIYSLKIRVEKPAVLLLPTERTDRIMPSLQAKHPCLLCLLIPMHPKQVCIRSTCQRLLGYDSSPILSSPDQRLDPKTGRSVRIDFCIKNFAVSPGFLPGLHPVKGCQLHKK